MCCVSPHNPQQRIAIGEDAVPQPGTDAAAQDVLHAPPVKHGHDGWLEMGFLQTSLVNLMYLNFIHNPVGLQCCGGAGDAVTNPD